MSESITYNMAPAYYRVMRAGGIRGGFRGLDGMLLSDVKQRIKMALVFTLRFQERLSAYDAENGWGSVKCVIRVLRAFEAVSLRGEDGIIRVT